MKRIIQLFILLLAVNTSYAQVLFEQDFESGTIAPMTMIDNDGLTPNANVSTYTDAWNVRDAANVGAEGSAVAVSNSWFSAPGAADDWMITPQLSITDAATALSWESQAVDPAFPDGYEVLVSTTGNDVASFTNVVWSVAADQSSDVLDKKTVSLADYVGSDIYIAFRNNSFDKFLLAIDNIKVSVIQARDIKVNSFVGTRYHVKNTDVAITANITNNGAETVESLDFSWSDGVNEYTETITGLSLGTGESMDITSSTPFQAAESISYGLNIWASNPNGQNDLFEGDNLIDASLAGVSYVPNRKIVVEEATGTWCGWCPRGAVGLDAMAADYSDNFIGIAVHNGDPMTITAYDGPVSAAVGGYPSGLLNRTLEVDPNVDDLRDNLMIYRDVVSPLAPSVGAVGDVDTRIINISAETEFVTQLDDADFRFAAVIIENDVTGTGAGWSQENYYSFQSQNIDLIDELNGINYRDLPATIPAEDMVYQHVARAILGGFDGQEGSVPSSVVDGDKATYDFTYLAPMDQDMNNMHVALLVIDNATGEILNAEEAKVMLNVGTTEIVDESISKIYPNPASEVAYIDINLQESSEVTLQVTDLMGRTITSENLGTLYGTNQMSYDVSNLSAGMYLFKVTAGELVSTKKITVAK